MLHTIEVKPVSMIDHKGFQRIDVYTCSDDVIHGTLTAVSAENGNAIASCSMAVDRGRSRNVVMLKAPEADLPVIWQYRSKAGEVLLEYPAVWKKPRQWTVYFMLSSHTDIGLHNSQYIQRSGSVRRIDAAWEQINATRSRKDDDRYRYVMEGTWFWNNYEGDKGTEAAQRIVDEAIKPGDLGICGGVAGNHTQVFGLEEMCRATYGRKALKDRWGIESETLSMIDNNGLCWGMVQPFAEAGFRNVIFSPNHWNPIPSQIWNSNKLEPGFTWNTEAGGGASRMDSRTDSSLPGLFYWQGADETSKLLVWAVGQYGWTSVLYGLRPDSKPSVQQLGYMEDCAARHLPRLEEKYPYDLWLSLCYQDDQDPDLGVTDCIRDWNACWAWPQYRTLGSPEQPFREVRRKFDAQIPVLKGDITGGWYQHPLSAPELLSKKLAADRMLPTAEKLCTLAAITDRKFLYPAEEITRAWQYLLWNDEHSYGVSGYQGRRVYETWIQHRDWIDKAMHTANSAISNALQSIARHIPSKAGSLMVFNPTMQQRDETIEGVSVMDIPPMGYRIVRGFVPSLVKQKRFEFPPSVENRFYRLTFAANGAITMIFDKQLSMNLLDKNARFQANEFVYTKDRHVSYHTPTDAVFLVESTENTISVIITMEEPVSGASITQTVTLHDTEKRIDLDNRLTHVRDMFNQDRYSRYCYYAFPFAVENARRLCHLNGCTAEYAKSLTGHGTDVYMPSVEWSCVENDKFGVGLMYLDCNLIEFDHIHPDKTDYGDAGDGSGIYVYLANDWLQMHVPGGSHIDFRFRFAITSYPGNHETAKLPEMAERYANPVVTLRLNDNRGELPEDAYSFVAMNEPKRLLTLKRAEDGNGLIARLYGHGALPTISVRGQQAAYEMAKPDESASAPADGMNGFATLRLMQDLQLKSKEPDAPAARKASKAVIGDTYTGLITMPRAARGEYSGHIYLLWGQCTADDLDHYDVYRSNESGFLPNQCTLVAHVAPEEYRVARYEDSGLLPHTRYYYTVCAVDKNGVCGPVSKECSAVTLEE